MNRDATGHQVENQASRGTWFLFALALLVFVGVVWSFHAYIAQRLVVDPALPRPWSFLVTGVIAAGGLLIFAHPLAERRFGPAVGGVLGWPGYIWMGTTFYLLFGLVLTDAGFALAGLEGVAAARARAVGVSGFALAIVGLSLRAGLREPALKRVEIEISTWPRALDAYRIVQISDIHVGSLLRRPFLERIVARCNALNADAIAITGDLVDGSVHHYGDEMAPLGSLSARDGVYFCTGNHDHFSGARRWVRKVESLGIEVLRNRHVRIERDGAMLYIAGVDDLSSARLDGSGHDLSAALRGWDESAPLLLLAHHPASFDQARHRGISLQLSGHTHGGQLWPFTYFVRLQTRYVAGLYRSGRSTLYVSRGTGFWGPPMRLLAPAEITELVVRAPRAGATA